MELVPASGVGLQRGRAQLSAERTWSVTANSVTHTLQRGRAQLSAERSRHMRRQLFRRWNRFNGAALN